jgi:hypothetical protein
MCLTREPLETFQVAWTVGNATQQRFWFGKLCPKIVKV